MVGEPKQLLEQLSHPGPHTVLRGDLALVGLPGVVFTPGEGTDLPAVAFGHGWLQPPGRYRALLHHLASWGIVAAAPAPHQGPFPSHRLFAADLRSTLDIVCRVPLGSRRISVSPDKLGLAGHSIGGGAAILTAADGEKPPTKAVATIAAAQTMPSATAAARHITAPGLHLTADPDLVAPSPGNAGAVASEWAGPVQLREISKSSHLAVTEGRHWSQLLLHGKPHRRTQRIVRALLTAFFLAELTGQDSYHKLLSAKIKNTQLNLENSHAPA